MLNKIGKINMSINGCTDNKWMDRMKNKEKIDLSEEWSSTISY